MKKCALCGKSSQISTTIKKVRSKYNPTSTKRKYPNLQWARLKTGPRVKACIKCRKQLLKNA